MKKITSIVLALALALSMSAVAFATDDGDAYEDMDTVTITKIYKATNEGTISPQETFTLEQVGDGTVKDGDATSAPTLGNITGAEFGAGAATTEGMSKSITIALPTYEKVGIYEYTLKEPAGTTAGVGYHADNIKLVVTVTNGEGGGFIRTAAVHTETAGDKADSIENTYSAGSLAVSKKVTGNLGDKDKDFNFKVTFTAPTEKTVRSTISYIVDGKTKNVTFAEGAATAEATFQLKHGETVTFTNIPYGVGYTVTETAVKGYTTDKNGDSGTISTAAQTAAFTNKKDGEVDTGIYLDAAPYILILAVVAVGAFFLLGKKRSARED